MKTFFIETKANVDVKLSLKLLVKLPKRLCLASSVQFVEKLPQLQRFLEENGKKASLVKVKHAKHPGQLLGCGYSSIEVDDQNTDAFLYVGDGSFHPKALLLGSDKDVYCFNPFTQEFSKLGREWAEKIRKRQKGALLTFLNSDRIGVIITLKPGQLAVQAGLKQIFSLQQKFPDKKFYFLITDTIDFQQLQNFTFVQCFVNAACNRLIDDADKFPKPVINTEAVLALIHNVTTNM